jgi:hypothetical protein
MKIYWLLAIAFLLFALHYRESFTDPEECTVTGIDRSGRPCVPKLTRPSMQDPTWRSKVDAEAPIGGNDEDYMKALQAFYDKVYVPATTRPKDTDVEAFLKTADAQFAGVDPVSLRRMIANGFKVELSGTAVAREQKQAVTTGALAGFSGSELQPGNARDEVYTRDEELYIPADTRLGEVPEGILDPVPQLEPNKPGEYDDKSTSWRPNSFYSVCSASDLLCRENVL